MSNLPTKRSPKRKNMDDFYTDSNDYVNHTKRSIKPKQLVYDKDDITNINTSKDKEIIDVLVNILPFTFSNSYEKQHIPTVMKAILLVLESS